MDLKENSVLIFKNDRKTSDTHPDYKGQINVDGRTLDIALWVKEGNKGKFFSGKISTPYVKPETDDFKIIDEPSGDLPF